MKRKFKVTVAGETYEVEVEEVTEGSSGDKSQSVSSQSTGQPSSTEQKAQNNNKKPAQERVDAPSSGKSKATTDKKSQAGGGDGDVEAPMAGKVLELKVSEGDQVNQGDLIMILEAMKMENEVYAPCGGTVGDIVVEPDQSVEAGDHIMSVE